MRNKVSMLGPIFCWVMLAALLLSMGCTPTPAPEVAAAVIVAATDTAVPATATPEKVVEEPTATAAATAAATTAPTDTAEAAAPTATPAPTKEAPASLVENGLSAWCLPVNSSLSNAKDPLSPPTFAKKATFENNVLQVRNMPAAGCMFLATFDKAAPAGLKLEVYGAKDTTPFVTADLEPSSSPETVFAFVQHGGVVSPSAATTSYSLVLKDGDGQELQKVQLKLVKWVEPTPEPKDCGCEVEW